MNIPKSAMAEYYITDLGWCGLAWPDLDTWWKPEAKDLENQRSMSYNAFGFALGPKDDTERHESTLPDLTCGSVSDKGVTLQHLEAKYHVLFFSTSYVFILILSYVSIDSKCYV